MNYDSLPFVPAHLALPTDVLAHRSRDGEEAARPAPVQGRHEEAVEYILTDCFISVGQGVRGDKTIEHGATMWLHDRYRQKFLRTMGVFGNTWLTDRMRVKGVSRMLGERAVYYAGDRPSIDLASVMQAAADVEKYCHIHAARRARAMGELNDAGEFVRRAGYWCEPVIEESTNATGRG